MWQRKSMPLKTTLFITSLHAFGSLALEDGMGLPVIGGLTSKLRGRAVQTEAVCITGFSWMNNGLGQSPCLSAAFALGACMNDGFDLPALIDAQHHYSAPNSTDGTATECSCSWAGYNLLQACAYCQGGPLYNASIFSWMAWQQNCSSSLLTDPNPFPLNIVIPNDTAIASWATTNPNTWPNQKFDPTTAQTIAQENLPDLTQHSRDSSNPKSKSHLGAIVGAVAGVIALLIAVAILVWRPIYRKRLPEELAVLV
ncbi:hypothetical protein BD410DRAFT_259218 [Rickenella mellea]|uniref:Uncharacterized protein n=1 Tax=Rickenella mellea TaxID=50990 RepID=A0A4Y7Q469_9AGAM|nr:hypothetical protein BD410DRAFT_259218 [Rickenella mellea]